MEITKEMLEAKLAEYRQAVEQHRSLADANAGAAQAMEELLAVANAPAPPKEASKK